MKKVCVIRAKNDRTPFLVDGEDYDFLKQFTWSHDGQGYAKTRIGKKVVGMHRLLLGQPQGLVVDHINRNRRDNRRGNLRAITPQENSWNRTPIITLDGFKGVRLQYGKWHANITVDGKRHHIGAFPTAELAALAYNDMAKEFFGEFAVLNEVSPQVRVVKLTAIAGRGEI